MSDLIDRQAAIDAFLTELTERERKNLLHTWSTVEVKYFITEMLEQLPSAQPEIMYYPQVDGVTPSVIAQPERKKGKWEMKWNRFFKRHVPSCSVCKAGSFFETKFCPNCGADMRGEEHDL